MHASPRPSLTSLRLSGSLSRNSRTTALGRAAAELATPWVVVAPATVEGIPPLTARASCPNPGTVGNTPNWRETQV